MKKLTNLALSLLLALVMVAGALPGVAQKADAASGVDVYIDVGAGHADLFTSDVLNQIKTEFLLQDATIEGNIITLKGVHPNNVEAELRIGIHNVVGLLISDSGYRHNGEELIDVAYKAIDDYATFQDYVDDTYNDAHETTNVSDGMTYYLLWKKPYEKLELDNGSPTCGKQASEAMPTIPDAFTLLEFETHWKDENDDSVETFEGGKKYTLKGVLEFQRSSGDFWKYYVPDDFVLTVEGGTGVECSVIVGTYIEFSFTATADHDWDAGTVTKEPTETTEGVKTYKCKHCDATKTEVIPKKGSPVVANAPKVTTTAKTSARSMKVKWTMTWGQVSGAKKYTVAYRKVGSNKWTYKNTKKTKYVVKKHKMKGLYEYKVAAVSSNGTVWSDTNYRYFSKVKTKAKAGEGAVKVSWKKDKGATGYQVKLATNKKLNGAQVVNVSADKKSYTFSGLKSGKKYYVSVRPLKDHNGVTYQGIRCKALKVKAK